MAQFDDNNNGTVDFDEFCALVTRSRSDSVNSQVESKVAEIAREAIATDEGAAGAPLQQTGADGGMAKTDAVEHLGAQLHAQANTRERQAQSAGFGGVVELIARPGDKECERVRSTLASLGIGATRGSIPPGTIVANQVLDGAERTAAQMELAEAMVVRCEGVMDRPDARGWRWCF